MQTPLIESAPLLRPGARVYLAGPMSHIPRKNFPAFELAAKQLRERGYVVISPAELEGEDEELGWTAAMRRDLVLLPTCDAVAVLPGHLRSRGVALELHVARELEMPVFEVHELTHG